MAESVQALSDYGAFGAFPGALDAVSELFAGVAGSSEQPCASDLSCLFFVLAEAMRNKIDSLDLVFVVKKNEN